MKVKQLLNLKEIRKEFPVLRTKVHEKKLIYLDNAATTQKPNQVISSITDFYTKYNSNVHRGIHKLSEMATLQFELAHKTVSKFINADFEEIIFTSGTTESLNLLANSLGSELNSNDEVVLTIMEHHSNLIPWQQMSKKIGFKLRFIGITSDGKLDMNQAKSLITKNTKIVSVVHVSNAIGTINPIKELIDLAHNAGAIIIIDAAQSVPHMTIDVKKLDCDFLVFSGHKMLGPTGIGVLYGKRTLLENMQPFLYGGNMIREVKLETSTWADLPEKFEAGTPNISGAIGLAAAINYLTRIGMNSIESYEKELLNYASEQLSTIKGITIYGPKDERSCVLSFNVEGIHPHDISTLLDREGVAVRGGHHCTMPLMKVLDLTGTVRASFYFYNTFEEVDGLVKAIIKAKQVFGYDS